MNKIIQFSANAWDDYLYWQELDKTMLSKINMMIKQIENSPFEGIGRPERLTISYPEYWSRRIEGEHRLIYTCEDNQIKIMACRYHHRNE